MAWADLFIRGFHELAWPVAAAWIAWYFRDPIVALLPRVNKIGPVGLETASTQQSGAPVPGEVSNASLKRIEGSVSPELLEEGKELIEKAFARDQSELKKSEHLLTLSSALLISGLFERTYAHIFGSQIILLQQANAAPVSTDEARGIYDRAKGIWPAIYQTYTFEQWVGFLEVAFLLLAKTADGRQFIITARGRGFLRYMVENGYSPARPN